MANKSYNKYPTVVTKPGGRVGGTNAPVKVVTNPTKYTGGKNPPAKVNPTK